MKKTYNTPYIKLIHFSVSSIMAASVVVSDKNADQNLEVLSKGMYNWGDEELMDN